MAYLYSLRKGALNQVYPKTHRFKHDYSVSDFKDLLLLSSEEQIWIALLLTAMAFPIAD